MIAALVPAMFVIAQPDLGSGMVYMVIAYMLLFVAGTSWRHLAALAALVVRGGAFVLVAAPAAGVHVLKPYQVRPPDGVPAPVVEPAEGRLPTAGVQDRDRRRGRRPAAAPTPRQVP